MVLLFPTAPILRRVGACAGRVYGQQHTRLKRDPPTFPAENQWYADNTSRT